MSSSDFQVPPPEQVTGHAPSASAVRRYLGYTFSLCALFIFGLLVGRATQPARSGTDDPTGHAQHASQAQTVEVWTCSMHPSVRADTPGKCPICAMDLIPLKEDTASDAAGERVFATSPAAAALMQVEVRPVERRFVDSELRLVGKVDYDETRLANIAAWVAGRIDRLYVDYTGIQVRKGDHLVYLYSPELLTAQDDLRRAARSLASMRAESPAVVRDSAKATLEATRAKLRRLGLTDAQLQQAESDGALSDHVTIVAPSGGTVISRQGKEGMYVETGTTLYTIADLSKVWVLLQAYEADLPWLHYGQPISFTTEAHPGRVFEGTIAFIDPMLDPATRTVGIRVNVPNDEARLKPGMFVRAVVRAQVATGGRVMDPGLAGKYICPMHPEIVKDAQRGCDVCGMDLVTSESLGYVSLSPTADDMPLVLPATAPLITGKRAIVYVQHPDTERPTYEGREIVLGSRAGAHYIVESGLREGELVVTNGAFKIDSALQILAKPSMMSLGDGPVPEHAHGASTDQGAVETSKAAPMRHEATDAFHQGLGSLFAAYVLLQHALADDDGNAAAERVERVREALTGIDAEGLPADSLAAWTPQREAMANALAEMTQAADIAAARIAFELLSDALTAAVQSFHVETVTPILRFHCPMALGDGAYWLQDHDELLNPYFGEMMLKCGTQEEVLQEGEQDA